MNIMLKTANFSANNIGQIDIPFEPSALTKSIMAKYSHTFTNNEQRAIDIFTRTLVSNSIWNKIKYLWLPVFAKTEDEAITDVKQSFSLTKDNSKGAPTYTVTENLGIKINTPSSSGNTNGTLKGAYMDISVGEKDYSHFMVYNTDNIGRTAYNTVDASYAAFSHTFGLSNSTTSMVRLYGTNGGPAFFFGSGSTNVRGDVAFRYRRGPLIQSNNNGACFGMHDAQSPNNITGVQYFEKGNNKILRVTLTCGGQIKYGASAESTVTKFLSYGAFSFGEYLTPDEARIYQEALLQMFHSIGIE